MRLRSRACVKKTRAVISFPFVDRIEDDHNDACADEANGTKTVDNTVYESFVLVNYVQNTDMLFGMRSLLLIARILSYCSSSNFFEVTLPAVCVLFRSAGLKRD